MYDWVPWFRALSQNIAAGSNSDLIEKVDAINWRNENRENLLEEYREYLDPFSILYMIAQYNRRKRTVRESVYREISGHFEIPDELIENFVSKELIFPTPNFMAKVLFLDERNIDQSNPSVLWKLFRAAVNSINSVDSKDFTDALEIPNVGVQNLTQVLCLVNPTEFIATDTSLVSLKFDEFETLPPPTEFSFEQYRNLVDTAKGTFPGCKLYEIGLFAYTFANNLNSFKPNLNRYFQVNTNSYNDGIDIWNEFSESNSVFTDRNYNLLEEAEEGSIVLARNENHKGAGIGVVYQNEYRKQEGWDKSRRIHVIWLNREQSELPEELDFQIGFSQIESSDFENISQIDSYKKTLRKLKEIATPHNQLLENLNAESVQNAIAECDKYRQTYSEDDFLRKYGSEISKKYDLHHDNEIYAPKAIVRAAFKYQFGFPLDNLSGGPQTNNRLRELGFCIQNKAGHVDGLCALCEERDHCAKSEKGAVKSMKSKLALNQILYGPPGTGKTWRTVNLALAIVLDKGADEILEEDRKLFTHNLFDIEDMTGQIAFTTFHQNYAYEDFVEGIRPNIDNKKVGYEIRDGIFKRLVVAALENKDLPYVLIIDEINRGNIAKIFGELITLIEDSKRLSKTDERKAILPYSQQPFGVPPNLYIIGTMNTADRSIQLLDTALRRRFTFVEMMPETSHKKISNDIEGIDCRKLLKAMNQRIHSLLDRERQIGHSYLFDVKKIDQLVEVFQNRIIPLLQEYFFDDWSKIRIVLGKNAFVQEMPIDDESLDGFISGDEKTYDRLPISDEKWKDAKEYQQIYNAKTFAEKDSE